jgi:16S rRNA processing protein RimM
MQVVVGRIRRAHGIRGDVAVEVRTDEPTRRLATGNVLATDPADHGPLTVTASRWHSGAFLMSFAEVQDRTAAEQLRGTWLVMDSADIGPTGDPDEFYDHELIGLTAVTVAGERIGVVTDVRHHGQDLLVIAPGGNIAPGDLAAGNSAHGNSAPGDLAAGDRPRAELLVPFVAPIVPEVDVPAGRLVIDPPPGLLDP